MTYQNIRFIAYTIGTIQEPAGGGVDTYPGVPAAPGDVLHTVDINARCDLMLRAIQTAAANLPTVSPPVNAGTELKVFMAPEFFFRGPLGAYSMEEVQLVTGRLQNMVKGGDWQDWLFVFGSILGYSFPTADTPPYDIDPFRPKEVYNFTLTQQGGTGSADGIGANAVVKELQAGCDFLAATTTADAMLTGNVEYMDAGASGDGREQQWKNYDGAGIFTQAGITWGVEICLDHYNSRYPSGRQGRLQRSPQLPGDQQIQVQLVPSGGMSIHDGQTMAMPGGYVFNCDGFGGGSAQLKLVNAAGALAPTLTDVPSTGSYAVDGGAIAVDASPPGDPVTIAQLYASGAGQIVLFGQVAVPAAAAVAGQAQTVNWPASEAYQFDFTLVYDAAGVFQLALCEIISTFQNFGGRQYFLPLAMQTKDRQHLDIDIDIELAGAVNNDDGGSVTHFDNSISCRIATREFNFEGIVIAFNNIYSGPDSIYSSFQ
jgi:hypothetical protein